MRLQFSLTLLVIVCFLAGLEASKRGGHHHKQKGGRKHGGHRDTWDKKSPSRSNKHEIHMKKISWLNVPQVVGCKCRHPGEICIEGPDKRPSCVQEHHLRESARLFKHYHEQTEKAEEALNEIDPRPRKFVDDAPHDVHINVVKQHKAGHNNRGHHKQSQHFLGLKPKSGKHNLVLNHIPKRTGGNADDSGTTKCDIAALDEMRRRLTGWFHLLHGKDHHHHHGNSKHHHKSHRHLSVKKELRESVDAEGKCDCLKSVMWEFRQIDTDHSHSLNRTEVKVIDNNDMEPCLHPYLMTCDKDHDGVLSRHEWCCCFPQREAESPCYAKLSEIERTKNTEEYIPSCDREGFYQKEQCMGTVATGQTCWCVTSNGSEIPGSRIKGRAHCGKLDNMGYPKNMS
ncbi:proteoglycan Cow-like [Littorina saxatilis]|uniref:Thyroglobulin type-1 domain-containing protein n=1 Tax=Littorina saxatilis TaxID=31220 RepID=A0AAN9BWG0_9CAEN